MKPFPGWIAIKNLKKMLMRDKQKELEAIANPIMTKFYGCCWCWRYAVECPVECLGECLAASLVLADSLD